MYIKNLIKRYPVLVKCENDIVKAYEMIKYCYEHGGKVLIAGNGGSASDAEHIVGELMKGFHSLRPLPVQVKQNLIKVDSEYGTFLSEKLQRALPAIALNNHYSLNTAFMNDVDGQMAYAQQVQGYGNTGDVLLCITTSGNSKNIIYAAVTAKAKEMTVIGLTGGNGGAIKDRADVAICVPETETDMVQELHLPVYHCLCAMLEKNFFKDYI